MDIPGPSDYFLEVLLEFDSVTFNKIIQEKNNTKESIENIGIESFYFDWLPKEIETVLLHSQSQHNGYPDIFFDSGINGKVWFLKNKILLKTHTD